jgi:hypothetical protein
MLSPIAWRTPPGHYEPWEQFASLLTEGLVAAVIADSRGSMGELISHGVTGFLVDDIDSAMAAVDAAGRVDRLRSPHSPPSASRFPP